MVTHDVVSLPSHRMEEHKAFGPFLYIVYGLKLDEYGSGLLDEYMIKDIERDFALWLKHPVSLTIIGQIMGKIPCDSAIER